MKTISEKLIDAVKTTGLYNDAAMARLEKDIETYDRPYYDGITSGPVILSVSSHGSVTMTSFGRFLNDPWSTRKAFKGIGKDHNPFMVSSEGNVTHETEETACEALYNACKAIGFPRLPDVNIVSGYMVTFDELRGSIPEHMREVFETRIFDENTASWRMPNMEKLREIHAYEVERILSYLKVHEVRVQVKDKDDETHEEWVTRPVSKIGFGFNRFENVPEGSRQSTAFFFVSDQSPEFKPAVTWNWTLQDTSRWMYAGAIAINYEKNAETGEETVSVSSNH